MIFSTYHSSPVVGEGAKGLPPFDLGVFDEAHKTTGHAGAAFAHALFDKNVRIAKRLFFTATPRHIDIRHRDKEGEFRVQSMDDESIYGLRAHTLSFAAAADRGIICRYKLIISLIDKEMVDDFARSHGMTLVATDAIATRWVAHLIALRRAIQTRARKIITFHSRVRLAQEFASSEPRGIAAHLRGYDVRHVNGEQPSAVRSEIIRAFASEPKTILTNARCLTEGVDIPAVDMVAFIDPRQSRIDIAQAVGRALRKPRGGLAKTVGYVVLPVFAGAGATDTLEEAIHTEKFNVVADVLNALQEHDEELVDIIREIKERKGAGDPFSPKRFSEKVEVIGPRVDFGRLTESIGIEVADRIGVSWDEMFGRLCKYKHRIGDANVLRDYEDRKLGKWVQHQRSFARNGTLSPERRERLSLIGFVFEPYDTQWTEKFGRLRAFFDIHGHSNVNSRDTDRDLARWVVKQRVRYRSGRIEDWQKKMLAQVRFQYVRDDYDRRSLAHIDYQSARAIARLQGIPSNGEYFSWARGTAKQYGPFPEGMPRAPQQVYKGAGWVSWNDFLGSINKSARDDQRWSEMFEQFSDYVKRSGSTYMNATLATRKLMNWVNTQRQWHREGLLDSRRKERLESVGMVWNVQDESWEHGYETLKRFKAREGHCNVRQSHIEKDGYALGRWVAAQRRSRDRMPPERKVRLDAVGFVWGAQSMSC